jgi:hypothetical protein
MVVIVLAAALVVGVGFAVKRATRYRAQKRAQKRVRYVFFWMPVMVNSLWPICGGFLGKKISCLESNRQQRSASKGA